MPILAETSPPPPPAIPPGPMLALIPAPPGLLATAAGTPLTGPVVAWALIADTTVAGDNRIDPVLLAAGRAWTPDQIRAAHGAQVTVSVAVA